jgi:hypothetical protein
MVFPFIRIFPSTLILGEYKISCGELLKSSQVFAGLNIKALGDCLKIASYLCVTSNLTFYLQKMITNYLMNQVQVLYKTLIQLNPAACLHIYCC